MIQSIPHQLHKELLMSLACHNASVCRLAEPHRKLVTGETGGALDVGWSIGRRVGQAPPLHIRESRSARHGGDSELLGGIPFAGVGQAPPLLSHRNLIIDDTGGKRLFWYTLIVNRVCGF
jgi:hypothetical protein